MGPELTADEQSSSYNRLYNTEVHVSIKHRRNKEYARRKFEDWLSCPEDKDIMASVIAAMAEVAESKSAVQVARKVLEDATR